jgi:hypothetical protein
MKFHLARTWLNTSTFSLKMYSHWTLLAEDEIDKIIYCLELTKNHYGNDIYIGWSWKDEFDSIDELCYIPSINMKELLNHCIDNSLNSEPYISHNSSQQWVRFVARRLGIEEYIDDAVKKDRKHPSMFLYAAPLLAATLFIVTRVMRS